MTKPLTAIGVTGEREAQSITGSEPDDRAVD